MEYVFINYATGRKVRVDGQEWGITNSTLMVQKGHHIFDLGEPPDYQPASVQTVVENTNIVSPLIINNFQPAR
jgi:hypothetical protein